MFNLILIIGIIAAIIMILIVLVQNPKGGGLASNFSSATNFFGAKQTTDGLEKITWGAAAAILVVSLLCSMYYPSIDKTKTGEKANTTQGTGTETDISKYKDVTTPKGGTTTPTK